MGTNDEYVEFAGADEIFLPENIGVYIGSAFDGLYSAQCRSGACVSEEMPC